ncbi:DSCAM [Mytilus coruscus]|uniref:DSCAM n=1 Tax=Mytilus coruscus TaxID=42192 RepID=A0A6J8A3U7_MYTCO|nr:DSCAM [Mytilus coruscus]
MVNYKYFSEGETVTLKCMTGANRVVWDGPALNGSNPSIVEADDSFGKLKKWMITKYTDDLEINQNIPNYKRLTFVSYNESGNFDLEISYASPNDVGYYRCAIDPVRGKLPHYKAYILQLKSMPTNITINNETEEETITGTENQKMKLVCNVESGLPPEKILWEMNGTILKIGGPRRIVYEFYPNRTIHHSNITCEVMNNVTEKPLTKSIRLDIKYKPEVLISRKPLGTLFEGSKKKLCCEINSNPNVMFMLWYKDFKTRIKNTSSLCLVLEQVTRQDSGNYTCLAGNEIGNGSSTTSLVVFYPPTVYVEYNNFSIHKNKRYVYCKADGVPNNFTFFRLEHKSHFDEHIRYLEVTSDGIAELPHTNESHRYQDTGLYMCNASNGVSDRRGKQFQQGEAYLVYNGEYIKIYSEVIYV